MYVPQPNDRVTVNGEFAGTVVGFGSMRAPLNCITHLRVGEGEWQSVVLVQIDRFQAHGPTACHVDNLNLLPT